MNELTIREFQPGDLPAIAALWDICSFHADEDAIARDLRLIRSSGNGAMFVADLDGGLVATVTVGHDGRLGWMDCLAVDPAQQHRGIGSLMVATAEAWLLERDVPEARVVIPANCDGAAPFYEQHGFESAPVMFMSKRLD